MTEVQNNLTPKSLVHNTIDGLNGWSVRPASKDSASRTDHETH